jgi:hypothetical protein
MSKHEDSITAAARQQNITVSTPYGTLHLNDVTAAQDHASMKAKELEAFFVMASGEGQSRFADLNGGLQNSLLWMAQQSASELLQLIDQVRFAAVSGASK